MDLIDSNQEMNEMDPLDSCQEMNLGPYQHTSNQKERQFSRQLHLPNLEVLSTFLRKHTQQIQQERPDPDQLVLHLGQWSQQGSAAHGKLE